jgi:hypothetical protein
MLSDGFTCKIGGILWRVKFVKSSEISRTAWGTCDHPPGKRPTICIRASMTPAQRLDTIIHETLHAALPLLDEEAVRSSATDIARVLTKSGYRHAE